MAALGLRNGEIWREQLRWPKRILSRNQADRVLSLRDTAGCGGGHTNVPAPPQCQIEFQAIAAGDDGAMQIGKAGEVDHGIDDLLPVCNGMRLTIWLSWRAGGRVMRRAVRRRRGKGGCRAHIEFDFARQFDDGFGMMAVFEQRVFDGLGAVDEQSAIEAILFLGDPVAAPVLADKDDGGCRAARWRFDELHVGIPSGGE